MGKDGELDRIHQSLFRIESKIDKLDAKQGNYVTKNESNIKAGILAGISLFLSGKMSLPDLIYFLKP
jgi:hypothetical protein